MTDLSPVPLSEADAPQATDKHRIVITFPDDHSINGMKVEIMGVTPEQCAVASFHISRAGNQVADARQVMAAQEASEIEAIRRNLRRS